MRYSALATLNLIALASPVAAWSPPPQWRISAVATRPVVSRTSLTSTANTDPLFVDNISKYKYKADAAVEEEERGANEDDSQPFRIPFPTSVSVVAATVGTFVMCNYLHMTPIGASSVAGLLAAFVLPQQLALGAFCGTVAGMAKPGVLPGLFSSTIMGFLCAALLAAFDNKKWLVGLGGRMRLVAQLACAVQFILLAPHLLLAAPDTLIGSAPKIAMMAAELHTVVSYTMLGALFTLYWRDAFAGLCNRLVNLNDTSFSQLGRWMIRLPLHATRRLSTSVGAAATTGFLASLLLQTSLAGPVFCGALLAMSASAKLPPKVSALVPACFFAGITQLCTAGITLGGWGGKLGMSALVGVLASRTFNEIPDDDIEDKLELESYRPEEAMVKAATQPDVSKKEAALEDSLLTETALKATEVKSPQAVLEEKNVPREEEATLEDSLLTETALESTEVKAPQAVLEEKPAPAEETVSEIPVERVRQVYNFRNKNQLPVAKSTRVHASSLNAEKTFEISVLMTVEGTLQQQSVAQTVTKPELNPTQPVVYRIPTVVTATDHGKAMEIPAFAAGEKVDSLSSMPTPSPSLEQARSFPAASPFLTVEGRNREYKVPAVVPVHRSVLPRGNMQMGGIPKLAGSPPSL
jgi:hypothetical protein